MGVTSGTGRLDGKHALVTGGIGFAIADRFLREGAVVVMTGASSIPEGSRRH
jgi:NAD(P)-dependent dehydrogenase (short-subunit alcohol dehydrogenase family)